MTIREIIEALFEWVDARLEWFHEWVDARLEWLSEASNAIYASDSILDLTVDQLFLQLFYWTVYPVGPVLLIFIGILTMVARGLEWRNSR